MLFRSLEDDDIVAELLKYESAGLMTIQVFIALNTMDTERRKRIYQILDVARMLGGDDTEEKDL